MSGHRIRTAGCACGSLTFTLRGEPDRVYACACLECQKATGSAFAYRARYQAEAIAATGGEARRWRRHTDSGHWMDSLFCPQCGTLVAMESDLIGNDLLVSVGCFAAPDFPPPAALFFARRKHSWYQPHETVRLVE